MTLVEAGGINPGEHILTKGHGAKLLRGDIIAVLILPSQLDYYKESAKITDYKFTVVADKEGQDFTMRNFRQDRGDTKGKFSADDPYLDTFPLPQGFIGIEIGKPQTAVSHSQLWDALIKLQGTTA